jgi:hypothetical protein
MPVPGTGNAPKNKNKNNWYSPFWLIGLKNCRKLSRLKDFLKMQADQLLGY